MIIEMQTVNNFWWYKIDWSLEQMNIDLDFNFLRYLQKGQKYKTKFNKKLCKENRKIK